MHQHCINDMPKIRLVCRASSCEYEKHCNSHCLQPRPEHESESASLLHPPSPLCVLQPHQHCINDMPKIRLVCRASSCEYEKHCNSHCLQPRPEHESERASLLHPPSPLCVLQPHQHCINDMPKIRLVCRASSCEYEKQCNRHCLLPRPEHESESASLVHPPPPLCVLQMLQHCINDMPKIRLVCRASSCEYEKHCNSHCLQPRPEHESESASLVHPPPPLCVLQMHQHCINDMPKIRLVCRASSCDNEKHCNRHCLQPRPEHESESASLVRPPPPLCVLQMLQHCIPGTWPRSDWCAEGAAVSMRSTAIVTACSLGLSINRRVHLLCAHLPRCAFCSRTSIALMTCPRSNWCAERAAVSMRSNAKGTACCPGLSMNQRVHPSCTRLPRCASCRCTSIALMTCPRSDWCAERAAVSMRSTAIVTACSLGLSMNQREHPSCTRLLCCVSCSRTSIALMTCPRSDWCAERAAVSMRSNAIGTACCPGLSMNQRVHPSCTRLPRCASCRCTSIAFMTCPRSDWYEEQAAVSMRSTAIGTVCSPGLSMNQRVHPSCTRLLCCASCRCTSIALMTCPRSDWCAERAAVSMRSTAIVTACSLGLSMNQREHPSCTRLLRCVSCSLTSIALMTHAQDQTGVQS
ncbi:hypothetical protein NDU88_008467 [Pleurodeles waltl]|uniref:Uncharacterized protein n=1 Tax=Pleurodeles waltl TaxID=8319 RepID=A0AAV7N7F1_PLEWA|nr:hypothetical protein NDU88_008467 [Pleurodeles waltl]